MINKFDICFNKTGAFKILEPLRYGEFITLERNPRFVLTDSGGIQEETTYLNVPCLTLRPNTERPITISRGTNELVSMENIQEKIESILSGNRKQGNIPEFWMAKPHKELFRFFKKWSYRIMIQAILKKGKVLGEDVPLPSVSEGAALIKVLYSCISVGTEIASVQEGNKSLIKRALEQPENVKKVLDMARSVSIFETFQKVKKKWEMGSVLGYSLSGVILALGNTIKDFKVGDRVACGGSGIANHAEYVDVPTNLMVKVPDGLELREASTVALGSIAMQGVRRANITVGEYVVIFGLGAIGQIALQIAKNAGARVIGIDLDERRLKVAEENGADLVLNSKDSDIVKEGIHFCDGYGADKVVSQPQQPPQSLYIRRFR